MWSLLRIVVLAGAMAFAFSSAHLVLPFQEREAPPRPKVEVPPEARIDVNTANVNELLKVPGMTRTWAARIIRFRPYRSKNELLDRGIVTSQVYDRIKDYIIAHRAEK